MLRILRRALLAVLVLAVGSAVGWHLYVRHLRSRFEQRVARLHDAGEPTRFTDLATPPIPDEENASRPFEEAQRILDERGTTTRDDLLLYKDERTPEEQAALARYLDSLAPYFDLLAQASERPGWRPDFDWGAGVDDLRMDYFSQLSDARSHVLARVDTDPADAGCTERAAKAATLLLALSTRCRGPFTLGYLVAETTACAPAQVLRVAMRRPGFDAALFRKIVDPPLARCIPERGPPRRTFVEERTFGLGALEAIAAGGEYSVRAETLTISWFQLPRLYRSGEHFLDVCEKALARCDAPPEDAILAASDLQAVPEIDDPWFGRYGRICAKTFQVFAEFVANRRLLRVVMALLEHRQREGAWPENLAILGEMPLDPYSGKPFQYRLTERGCEIRSARPGTPEDLEDRNLLWALAEDQIPAMKR